MGSGACADASGPPEVDVLEIFDVPVSFGVGASAEIVVEARDASGGPIAGAVITLRTEDGSGVVAPTEGVTGQDGRLGALWTLGPGAGSQVLSIETNGAEHMLVADAEPAPPEVVVVASGDAQNGAVGDPLAEPVVFESQDAYGNPSGGADLTIAIGTGGGSVDRTTGTTGPDGRLPVQWTLGPDLGAQRITAHMGTSSVDVSSEAEAGPAATLEAVSGDGQSGVVGSTLPDPLTVQSWDRFGNPARTAVTFRADEAGGHVTIPSVVPGVDGVASTGWVVGTLAGAMQVTASVPGASPISFTATVLPGEPAALLKTSGEGQTGPATLALSQPLEVRVVDAYGNGVPDSPVVFAVTEGGGSVQPSSTSTDSNGFARVTFTLGPVVGAHGVSVTYAGAAGSGGGSGPVTFQATATSLPPAQVVVVAGSGQTAQVGSAVTSAPTVLVSDAVGNPVPGVAVSFSASDGGSVSGGTPTTGATGVATVGSWLLGTTAGQQTLTATVDGIPPVSLTAVAVPGPASTLQVAAGDGQSATIGSPVGTAPAVNVVDVYGNGVAGVMVTFTVTGGGGSVSGGLATSSSSGRAAVGGWTLGPNPGGNSLEASAGGLTPVSFGATGTVSAPGFNLEIQFVGSPSAAQQSTIMSAAARWNGVITGDIPDATANLSAGACGVGHPGYNGTVDDLVVFVEFVTIDGPGGTLGSAGPCWIRGGSMLPIFGSVRMDAADAATLESNGRLYDVVLHELGHVLGIGTLWQANGLLQGAGGADPYFSGAAAVAEYQAGGGGHPNPVPVENTGGGGTRDAHWRDSLFSTELMTGWVNYGVANPLSRVTAASLSDIGYAVNIGAADSFAAAAPSASPPLPPLKLVETPLGISIVIR